MMKLHRRHMFKSGILYLFQLPAVDWLLLSVNTVADWLFMVVVEQQAEIFVRDKGQNFSKIYLDSLLSLNDLHSQSVTSVSHLVWLSTHLVQVWWTVE